MGSTTMRIFFTLMLCSLVTSLTWGCDSKDDPTTPAIDAAPADSATADGQNSVDAGVQDTPAAADLTVLDTNGPEDVSEDEIEPVIAYPEGPYGKAKDSVMEDLAFYDPWEDRMVYLHEFHNDPQARLLLISSAAGWCGACQYEAEDFVELYDKWEWKGLRVLYTLYEDQNYKPLFTTPDTYEYSMAFMEAWKSTFVVDYPLVADSNFVLESYFNQNSTPLTMVVTTKDMVIRYKDHGYSYAQVNYQMLKYLNNPDY